MPAILKNSLYLVMGPSGAGKSHLHSSIRESEVLKEMYYSFDLDFVGFRTLSDSWKEWTIPPSIFETLAAQASGGQRGSVAVGSDSHTSLLVAAARRRGFEPLVILPSVETLSANRVKRKDDAEKVAESAQSIDSWSAIATQTGAKVFASSTELLTFLGGPAEVSRK